VNASVDDAGPASVQAFYDDLASAYHLIYTDWDASVRRQGAVLHELLVRELGPGPRAVLDAACGIGTQAIGLALHEHRVTGTDLSSGAVRRASAEAARFGVELTAAVADLRELGRTVTTSFDVVMACDNSLPHLLTDEDLARAVSEMAGRLAPGGLFVASMRDYDALLETRPATELPRVTDRDDGRWITFQVWDWAADGRSYEVSQFILHEHEDGWTTRQFVTIYRALRRTELAGALGASGLVDLRWHEPEETGFHQPIVTGWRTRG
jgi:glycine/sarcosine N-methyltransferase